MDEINEALDRNIGHGLTLKDLRGVIYVTVAYFVLYYVFLFTQSYVKVWLVNASRNGGKGSLKYETLRYASLEVAAIKYGSTYSGPGGTFALVMDRSVGNFLEQQCAFITSLWLQAILVPGGCRQSTILGSIYIISRLMYPVMFYVGHPWLQLATVPGYVIIWYQLARSVWAVA